MKRLCSTVLVLSALDHRFGWSAVPAPAALAGDVLAYMGDLRSLFLEVQNALRPNGWFLFNTEIGDDQPFKMNQSGRFSHQKKYLEQLASDHHFDIIFYQRINTRMQNNEPVYGHLFLLKKY